MKLGFIGCGNMGKAMLGGILKNQILEPGDVCVSALHQNTLDEIHKTYQVDVTLDNREVAKAADILILAVKPQYYGEVIEEIRDVMKKDAVFVSIAPGKRMEWFYGQFGRKPKIVRCMPGRNDRRMLQRTGQPVGERGGLEDPSGLRACGRSDRAPDGCCGLSQRKRAGICISVY